MYRRGKEYDRMAQLAIQLYLDYNITEFPINPLKLCDKLGIILVPYSAFSVEEQELLLKRSEYAFFVPMSLETQPMIFYNDMISSEGCIRLSIFHEIKHFVDEDDTEDPEDDDLADYFGKYLACPVPYLVIFGINNPMEIVSKFGLSFKASGYLAQNVDNRRKKYGDKLFPYEKPLIKHLLSNAYDIFFEEDDAV